MEIIVSHNNTDLDGLAAMIAAKKLYPDAELVYSGKLHRNVREFMALHKDTFNFRLAKDIPLNEVKTLIMVDTKSPSRIGDVRNVFNNPGLEIHIYDHHPRAVDDAKGDYEIVEQVGAATTILVELIRKKRLQVNSFEATVFAMGIYEDTGSLTFSTTTPRDARSVAYLLSKGAKLSVVADFIDRPLSDRQKGLLNTLIVSSETLDINGIKVLISSGSIDEYVGGLALLVHKLLDITNSDVAIAAVRMDDRIHVVARSQDDAVDVSKIVLGFNGGGHSTAASATVREGSVDEIVLRIKKLLRENVRPETTAKKIMSAPVKIVPADTTIEEAGKILLRYGHTGLPVVDGEKMVGIISRRDIDKAKHHGLGHAPVKGFMSRRVITISPQTTLPEVQHLMIDHNIGRLPVIDGGKIVGIVSRTDVLRTLHGENYPEKYERIYNITQPVTGKNSDNVTELMVKNLPPHIRDLLGQVSYLADRENFSVFAVGGFVRDLILGVENLDIDLVVEGDGLSFARCLAEFLCGRVRIHEKFGTAMVILPDNFRIDVATARTEYYEYPAALPKVEVSSLKQDLYRRDFTINSMAITLSRKNFGGLVDYFGGRRDLEEGSIRVLYNLSFVEDPTRILRAIRFEQRYDFEIESQTLSLAKRAIKSKMLTKLSVDRVREELKHILGESSAVGAILRMKELGVWPFILPEANIEEETMEIMRRIPPSTEFILNIGLRGINNWIIYLAVLVRKTGCQVGLIDERLRLTKDEQKKLGELLCRCPEVIQGLSGVKPMKMSEIASVLRDISGEGYVYILSDSASDVVKERLRNYLARSIHNKLNINGDDIKELGFVPGPHFKEVLDALGEAKLDGDVNTREEEIKFVKQHLKKMGIKKDTKIKK
ncbi:MAG: polynucleotide adenylyltransferase [Firmicutes bacterium HGW-Firmicutes-14]|nr:MAG: polynucleotide adenylyltransferase [Firmicutes bacterium HGW-Firmicutes-14]